MCQIWLRSNGRVKKRGVQTDKGTLQLYIVDNNNVKTIIWNTNHTEHLGWSRDGFSPRKKSSLKFRLKTESCFLIMRVRLFHSVIELFERFCISIFDLRV